MFIDFYNSPNNHKQENRNTVWKARKSERKKLVEEGDCSSDTK